MFWYHLRARFEAPNNDADGEVELAKILYCTNHAHIL